MPKYGNSPIPTCVHFGCFDWYIIQSSSQIYSFIHSFAQQLTHVQHLVKTYCKMDNKANF